MPNAIRAASRSGAAESASYCTRRPPTAPTNWSTSLAIVGPLCPPM